LQFAIAHTSWIGLVRIVSLFGSRRWPDTQLRFAFLFHHSSELGLSNAAATLVGQNWAQTTATSGNISVAHGFYKHAIPWDHRGDLHLFCGAGSSAIHERPGSGALAASCCAF